MLGWQRRCRQTGLCRWHIKRRYVTASFLAGNVAIFNVRGNRYRLVVKVNYPAQVVLVKWFGTHAEYDKERF